MSPYLEIQIIAIIVAIALSIPGVFLVLRKMAMMSDAITHTILLGIVLAFFIVNDLSSPLLIIGATLVGLLTVYLVEVINRTRLVSEDSAIGIVFPLLFSVAIILVSRYAGNIHLDTDAVLYGEIAFAPFTRMEIFGLDIPKAMFSMGIILILNILMVVLFFKEIKIVIFDKGLASVLGFMPILVHYGLMTSVSITAVGAFNAVGSILVVAFMIGPPVSAYLITDDLKKMLIISAIIGALNAILGFRFALILDVSIAGSMALATGLTFLLVFTLAPQRGMITVFRRRQHQKIDFAGKSLLFHIYNHEGKGNESIESGTDTIYNHLNWSKDFLNKIINNLTTDGNITVIDGVYKLTDAGREYTIKSYEDIVESLNDE